MLCTIQHVPLFDIISDLCYLASDFSSFNINIPLFINIILTMYCLVVHYFDVIVKINVVVSICLEVYTICISRT